MGRKLVSLSGGCLESIMKAQKEYNIKPGPTARKLREALPDINNGNLPSNRSRRREDLF